MLVEHAAWSFVTRSPLPETCTGGTRRTGCSGCRTVPTLLVPTQLAKYEKPCAEPDRDIRHVEHSGTERSYAHVQEVNDAASKNAVYPIRGATRNKEDKSELRRSRVLPSEGQHQQCRQCGPCRDREDGISRDGRQVGPKTQKSATILDVADTYRV